ncbi:CBS domain-containing protein [Desulfovibrio oxyclinae]|jgi:CBS domain-containing protein|uniref:CBS domain-containing protein n=1 Tax=Desulfovibrio oxyclinae TaxID=63560 RepID=UPI00037C35BC|nr:CBS domain-containing protein [Desulfovibrio oxyclinae]
MLKAIDIMTNEPITLTSDTDISTAVKTLLENRINGVPVVDDGKVVGVLTQTDLVAQQKKLSLPSFFTLLDGVFPLASLAELDTEMQKITALTVNDAMTKPAVTVSPDTGLDELAAVMSDKKLYTLPVVDGDVLVGVVGKEDVLGTLIAKE